MDAIAVFFARRGHGSYRVSSVKAADLRRFLGLHAKSNGIDAGTLAGCRWPTAAGCSSWSCLARTRPRWTGGSGRVSGWPAAGQ